MKNQPHFFIGSLPFLDPNAALDFVAKNSRHLPFLPQLPAANPQEDMIGQVLRGFEIGGWDEKASCCLKPFLSRYAQAKRIKIQIAGPFTVARAMSIDSADCAEMWVELSKKIIGQVSKSGFDGEIWLQIDEPFWSSEKELFRHYEKIVGSLKIAGKVKLGIHSCATSRPRVESLKMASFDFWSFDYTSCSMTEDERAFWTHETAQLQKILAVGIYSKENAPKNENVISNGANVWVSAGCGLADWNEEEIQTMLDESYGS
jgi:methionine synthase II (cobalamin-independent)